MRTVIVRDAMRIPLGKQGENNAVRVVWPGIIESYAKLYGEGDFSLVVLRPGDSAPYPAVVAEEGTDLVWTVGSADTAKDGYGNIELTYTVGGVVAKSQTWGIIINASLSGQEPTDPPEPQKNWVDAVLAAGATAEASVKNAQKAAEEAIKGANQAANAAQTASGAAAGARSAAQAAETAKAGAESEKTAAETAQKSAQQSAGSAAKDANDAKASADSAKQAADRALTIIDDTALAREKTWSSRNIVDMVCPDIEETGNPVVCTPVPNYPLGVKARWAPTQEGSGEPSPDNIRPIKGRDSVTAERKEDSLTRNLTLPSTIYGGEVDAVTGEGQETWACQRLNEETKITYNSDYKTLYVYLDRLASRAIVPFWSHFGNSAETTVIATLNAVHIDAESLGFASAGEFKSYCAAQYAAGTPVQIAYQLAEPTPFAATGGAPIHALNGTNTILTDADSVTVTGRETPQSYVDRKLKETNAAIAAL